jgi:urease accessory protein
MDTAALLDGLRFVDSFFPSGGYAYSSGLEAAVQGGAVKDSTQLATFVEDLLNGGMSRREATAACVACRAGASGDAAGAMVVDRELDGMKLGREGRLASRQMGRQVMKIAAEQLRGKTFLRSYLALMEREEAPGHLPVCLGLTLGACGWKEEEAVAAYLYQTAVGFVSAAMRLLPIGQRESQHVLAGWLPLIHRISRDAKPDKPMISWSPVQDIYGMQHGHLSWRLFRS